YYIGGYSLAGLFALWVAYQTDVFSGVAAASPSMWFPDFIDYMKNHEIHVDKVYLSLGNKEEKTKNTTVSTVGNRIKEAQDFLTKSGIESILEWNEGNHFRDMDIRTAKAFAWVMANNNT
ncbi:MAG: esterase, partial [Lachnospiraceae bacterium]|nr:esterase [Lachnospiraceae bacterium]